MIIGAILAQSVAWSNVKQAVDTLKTNDALDPVNLYTMPVDDLANLIRPSGYFNVKARKVKAFLDLLKEYEFDLDALFSDSLKDLRECLLSVKGIGPETADSIILYAAYKPIFVVDAYTKRLMHRLGFSQNEASYEELRTLFEAHLPHEVVLFQDYHALVVHHGNSTCRKRPVCTDCPLFNICNFSQTPSGF
ncbi:MAG: hypothetical protein Q7R39_13035 [Dehalococcoidia bacterium]|nr:hypothetical protein [Dehalococcoidia bacterium]